MDKSSPGNLASYDQETIKVLKIALEDAWAKLLPKERACMSKSALAEGILKLAAQGERDPIRLRTGAMTSILSFEAQGRVE